MKNLNPWANHAPRRIRPIAAATALVVAVTIALSPAAAADEVTPFPVPANLQARSHGSCFASPAPNPDQRGATN